MSFRDRVRAFVSDNRFEGFIVVVILLNAMAIGVQTYADWPFLKVFDKICVGIFVAEIALRFTARRSAREYFSSGWNWFDIIVVAGAFVPFTNGISTALRVLRVFRLLRLIRFIPELRLITSVLIRSLKSMTYIGMLMLIIAYIYAIIGFELFGEHMWEYATLHETFFSLFRSLTVEDWTDLRYDGLDYQNYWIVTFYHVSWIVVGTFVMINLVVGAILNNYNTVQEEEEKRRRAALSDLTPEEQDERRLKELTKELHAILARRDRARG